MSFSPGKPDELAQLGMLPLLKSTVEGETLAISTWPHETT